MLLSNKFASSVVTDTKARGRHFIWLTGNISKWTPERGLVQSTTQNWSSRRRVYCPARSEQARSALYVLYCAAGHRLRTITGRILGIAMYWMCWNFAEAKYFKLVGNLSEIEHVEVHRFKATNFGTEHLENVFSQLRDQKPSRNFNLQWLAHNIGITAEAMPFLSIGQILSGRMNSIPGYQWHRNVQGGRPVWFGCQRTLRGRAGE